MPERNVSGIGRQIEEDDTIMILEKINEPSDVKKLTYPEMEILAGEIRDFLVDKISQTGGHLASNLGVVELTIALYRVFNFPDDKVIWDVGHQAYTHKILSGRKAGFEDLRKYGGLSGFPNRFTVKTRDE